MEKNVNIKFKKQIKERGYVLVQDTLGAHDGPFNSGAAVMDKTGSRRPLRFQRTNSRGII